MKKDQIAGTALLIAIMFINIGFTSAPPKRSPNNWSNWSKESLAAIEQMILKYGEPSLKNEKMAVWYDCKPWKRTVVYSEAVPHEFPDSHRDVLEQTIDYRVPYYKFNDLMKFNGSITCSRTKGELTVCCSSEQMNFLIINLANEIVQGRKDVKTAREIFAATARSYESGVREAYTQKLINIRPIGAQRDPDVKVNLDVVEIKKENTK